MAPGGTGYTVIGFGSGFDGQRTVFVNAFPPTRVCSACGLVPSAAGFLPCRHVLCHRCYDRCTEEERSQCPFDQQAFQREDVVWSTFPKDNILNRKIQCWNARNGCDAVGPASEILAHFNDHCQYYAVTCQGCRRIIAQKEVVDHLKSGNCVQGQPQVAPTLEDVGAVSLLESLQSLDNRLTESTRLSLDAIKDIHEAQTSLERNMSAVRQFSRAEIEGILGQLESRVRILSNENTEKVLAACASIETLTNALKAASLEGKKETGKIWKALEESINKRSGIEEQLLHMKKELDEKFSIVMDASASKAILENKLTSSEPFEWTIDGWSKLKDEKKRGNKAVHYPKEPGYFYGYSILPGAEIIDIDGTPTLRLVIHICKGLYDRLLAWPFEKRLHFKVIHPCSEGNERCQISSTKNNKRNALQIPTTSRSDKIFAVSGIAIETLEANGYVRNDKVSIRFEVFP